MNKSGIEDTEQNKRLILVLMLITAPLFSCNAQDNPRSVRPVLAAEAVSPLLPSPDLSIDVRRKTSSWSKRARWSKSYPEGTVRLTASMHESGGFGFRHEEYRVPPGKDARRRWDFGKTQLPDGTLLLSNSIGCTAPGRFHGNGNFNKWNLLNITVVAPDQKDVASILRPSKCVAVHRFQGKNCASAQMIFERPLAKDCTPRTSIRIRRVRGSDYLYMRIHVVPDGAEVREISVGGYPMTTHPSYMRFPGGLRSARFIDRYRWVWTAGKDWNMHDRKQKHSTKPKTDENAGIFWYNRDNCRLAGMEAIFLPEQIQHIRARGTYGVSVTMQPSENHIRLAIREWKSWNGWHPERKKFTESLPRTVKALRQTDFSWPINDLLGKNSRKQCRVLLSCEKLDQGQRRQLKDALQKYQQSLEKLKSIPARGTPTRLLAEQEVIVREQRVKQAIDPLTGQWLKQGGIFEEG
ncbi:MAG: hypothetical protein ACLFWL_05565 [Candidatus Brocadiia bacterium]